MLKNKLTRNLYKLTTKSTRGKATTVTVTNEKWDVLCGVCLERKPTIVKELSKMELDFSKVLADVEYENSMKSDYEITMEMEQKKITGVSQGKVVVDEMENTSALSAIQIEDRGKKELTDFKPASRETAADSSNNVKSPHRRLDRSLLYLVKEKLGNDELWVMPQGRLEEGETLRQAAERILRIKFGPYVKAQFLGNAPFGVYKYKYPVGTKDEITGAKIFYLKAQYFDGNVENGGKDYVWATRDELQQSLTRTYYKEIKNFLIMEDIS